MIYHIFCFDRLIKNQNPDLLDWKKSIFILFILLILLDFIFWKSFKYFLI